MTVANMRVTPIAHTIIMDLPESIRDTPFAQRVERDWGEGGTHDIDVLHEFAGRSCYQSWNLPNPDTAHTQGYIKNIIEQDHGSVLEHGSVTFYVEGVSRSLSHELIRHRHLSYSELSQRFVNIEHAKAVLPPAIQRLDEHDYMDAIHNVSRAISAAQLSYERLVVIFNRAGLTRKEAREAARAVMANMIETKIVVTGNLRAWRYVIQKRTDPAADAEIQQLGNEILGHLRELAPASVQDFQ